MKLMIASDLHFEFHKDYGESFINDSFCKDNYDVLILAGDIQINERLEYTFSFFSKIGKPVVYVPGNHEYYYSSFPEVAKTLKKIKKLPNIYPLNNNVVKINKQRFVGTTLWFKHSGTTEITDRYMNCFSYIKHLTTRAGKQSDKSIKFLDKNLKEGDVVITHHLPHNDSVSLQYRSNFLNKYYVNHLGPLVENCKAKLWISGHSHGSFDKTIGSTRLVRNPYGYLNHDVNPDYKETIIEI